MESKFESRIVKKSDLTTAFNKAFYEFNIEGKYIYIIKPFKKDDNIPIINYYLNGELKYVFSIKIYYEIQERRHIRIYCHEIGTENIKNYYYYTSKSEGMLWRLCLKNEGNIYHKGFNYTSTTFINMELQRELNLILEKNKLFELHLIDHNPTEHCPVNTGEEFDVRINKLDNVIKDPVFSLLDVIFPNVESYRSPERYNQCVEKLLTVVKLVRREFIKDRYSSQLSRKLAEAKVLKYDGGSRREFYKRCYHQLLLFFLDNFDKISDREVFIEEREIKIEDIEIKTRISRIKFKSKYDSSEYYLYYMTSKPKLTPNSYRHIINITKISNNYIQPSGLDNEYVSTGILINKLFEYVSQIKVTRLEGTEENIYTFIGDVFDITGIL